MTKGGRKAAPHESRVAADVLWDVTNTIEAYRIRWKNTGNQFFIFKAISLCDLGAKAYGPLPLPDWCAAYLGVAMAKLSALAEGFVLQEMVGVTSELQALGLQRKNSSALTEFRSLEEKSLDLLTFEQFTEMGEPPPKPGEPLRPLGYGAALKLLAEEAGIETRGMEKRLQAARDAEASDEAEGIPPKDTSKLTP